METTVPFLGSEFAVPLGWSLTLPPPCHPQRVFWGALGASGAVAPKANCSAPGDLCIGQLGGWAHAEFWVLCIATA